MKSPEEQAKKEDEMRKMRYSSYYYVQYSIKGLNWPYAIDPSEVYDVQCRLV